MALQHCTAIVNSVVNTRQYVFISIEILYVVSYIATHEQRSFFYPNNFFIGTCAHVTRAYDEDNIFVQGCTMCTIHL